VVTGCHDPLNTSTLPVPKFVAYRRGPSAPLEIARPLYSPPGTAGTVTTAAVEPPRQALIVPSSLAKMKFEGPSVFGLSAVPTWDCREIPELTQPVGAPGTPWNGFPPIICSWPAAL